MKLLVLTVSLAANLILFAAFVVQPALAPPAVRGFFQPRAVEAATAGKPAVRAAPKTAKSDSPTAQLWPALHSTDLASLVARLRAAGFPPGIVRAVVDAEIEARFAPRLKALTRTTEETPYWKPDPSFMGNSKFFEEMNQIYRERSRVLRELLGKDVYAWSGSDPNVAQRRQFGNLSQAKIDLVQRINDDYAEMTSQVRAAMQGVTLPEDRQKMTLLEREKRADLAQLLTPEELTEYELRSSPTTGRLRNALTIMDASETEFRTLFQIQQPFNEVINPTGGIMSAEMSEQRRETIKLMNEKLKAALGDERFAQYQRATDREYQQLYRLGQQANVAPEALARAFDLRDTSARASSVIFDDRTMSVDDKRTALKNLAQNTRTQLLATLGPNVGPTYTDNSRWLTYLDQGNAITVAPEGYISPRMLPAPRTGTPPKK